MVRFTKKDIQYFCRIYKRKKKITHTVSKQQFQNLETVEINEYFKLKISCHFLQLVLHVLSSLSGPFCSDFEEHILE